MTPCIFSAIYAGDVCVVMLMRNDILIIININLINVSNIKSIL